MSQMKREVVSILILLDYLFLSPIICPWSLRTAPGFNPYFIGLPILIYLVADADGFNPMKVSILILLDYLFL